VAPAAALTTSNHERFDIRCEVDAKRMQVRHEGIPVVQPNGSLIT
jgi:hypothetical protein